MMLSDSVRQLPEREALQVTCRSLADAIRMPLVDEEVAPVVSG